MLIPMSRSVRGTALYRAALRCAVLSAASLVLVSSARADEGMWTYDNVPVQKIKARYGFEPNQAWLDHVRLSSVRFNDGGSGSFISETGLVLTNHHVARGQLQKVSTPQKDYVTDGFLARANAQELPCPDLELNVLVSLENVTARVQGAAAGKDGKAALDARKTQMGQIEKESLKATGLRSDVVSLYQGGEYWLYRYKKFTDVRLVFAPEQQIAFYGGDPDNFTYPRHDLDMAIFRVYENGKPVSTPHFLKWNPKGAVDGEPIFISGHPGSTDRLDTLAQLEYMRDHELPLYLKTLNRRLNLVKGYAARGPEEARQAGNTIFGLENSLKAIGGEYEGLKVPQLLAKKAKDEAEFRSLIAANPEWQKAYGSAWNELATLEKKTLENLPALNYRRVGGMRLPALALNLVRYGAELAKPDGQRLPEFHDAGLESLKFRLVSPAPVYPALEEAMLADSLQQSLEELGAQDPFVVAALGGRKPAEVAHELLSASKLADPAERKKLVEGGTQAIAASKDPLIVWVRSLDPGLRELRKWQEENIQGAEVAVSEKIGKARFAAYGKALYPDATFTLRLSYGAVKGYPMNGTLAPSKTTFHGLFDRSASFDFQGPFALPKRYLDRKDKLDLNTPLDFVATGDIIGGNSGSPVVNRAGEIVGLIFDGNIESLVGRFVYDETANRAVAVHTAGMTEALKKIYDADELLKELLGK